MSPRRARICLITPGHLSTNPRLVKEADALWAAGYHVTVIAAAYQAWAAQADEAFGSRPWRTVRPLTFGPEAPAGRRAWQLVRHRSARWIHRRGGEHPAVVRAALHPAAPDLAQAALATAADLYIAHYAAALPAAALAARRHGGLYAFDAEDFHQGQFPPGVAGDRERSLVAAIEGACLPGCAYISAASPGIADAYAESYGIARPTVILNVFPRAQGPRVSTLRGTAAPGPSLYWFSQTLGPNRGLETAIRAIARTRSRPHLHLRGAPASGYIERLKEIARQEGVQDQLHCLEPAPPAEMERLASAYDIGFSGEPGHTPNNRLALGNKIFSYLLAGIPVVASAVPSHMGLAPALGCAARLFSAEEPGSAAIAIDGYLGSDWRLAASRQAAFQLGQTRFNWDLEQQVLLERVRQAMAPRRTPGR